MLCIYGWIEGSLLLKAPSKEVNDCQISPVPNQTN